MKYRIMLALLFFGCSLTSRAQTPDSTQIRLLLEKESATWRSGDIQAHADCWHIQPYSKIWFSGADGKFTELPPDFMIHPPAGAAGKGGTSVNSQYNMSIHDNSAWVTHEEVSISAEGKKSYTSELRLLEKIDGQWKLVGASVHGHH